MAFSLGEILQDQARQKAMEDIARQTKAQQEQQGKRKKWASIIGGGLGALGGIAAVGALGLTGGLAAPLVMGAVSSLSKKWVDEGSKKGLLGKGLKGADVSKIKGGKYGYGKKQAKEYRTALGESRKTDWGADTLLGDIATSYISAGMSGGLTGGAKTLMSGDKGSLLKSLGGAPGSKGGWEGVKQAFGSKLGGLGGRDDLSIDLADADTTVDYAGDFSSEFLDQFNQEPIGQSYEVSDSAIPFIQDQGEFQWPSGFPKREGGLIYQQGGQVPSQNELLGLAILSQMQNQQKAYDDTPLEQAQPTISDYFASEGKTLGGSNTKSLSQLLGR